MQKIKVLCFKVSESTKKINLWLTFDILIWSFPIIDMIVYLQGYCCVHLWGHAVMSSDFVKSENGMATLWKHQHTKGMTTVYLYTYCWEMNVALHFNALHVIISVLNSISYSSPCTSCHSSLGIFWKITSLISKYFYYFTTCKEYDYDGSKYNSHMQF